jgi:hypothetical protein
MITLLSMCVYVCISPPNNFRMLEPIFMKLGKYIMALEPISVLYFTSPFHQWYQNYSISCCWGSKGKR